jgi:hypothetical protein
MFYFSLFPPQKSVIFRLLLKNFQAHFIMKRLFIPFVFALFALSALAQNAASSLTAFNTLVKNASKQEGFFTFYHDDAAGKIWLSVPVNFLNKEFLYVNSLPAGVGSNDIGLDRNQLGNTRIVYFTKNGSKLLMVQPNYDYRAVSSDAAEKASVRDAFASSAIAGFKVEAEEDGKLLIDLTPFLMRDAHSVAAKLKRANQGIYKEDISRSMLYPERIKNFPKNTEFEAIITFEAVSGTSLNYEIGPRRAGDIVAISANNEKAISKLGWKINHSIEDMMRTAWAWEKEVQIKDSIAKN